MIRTTARILAPIAFCAPLAMPAAAQEDAAHGLDKFLHPGAGIEVWASTDSDDTDVIKVMGKGYWDFEGRDSYKGIAVEKAWFTPSGTATKEDERAYLDLADKAGENWLWQARIGTDGDTVLGSASIRSKDWSKSFFVEREIIESRRGVDEGIYYTFAGASFDFPVDDRNVFTAMAGVQEFTGTNERLHLRGNYIHVVKPEWGLSAQLRGRYYHSTTPGEFDYFSPRDYVEVLPVVQLRRFTGTGWMYQLAGGYGAQYAKGSGWQESRFADLRVESPANSHKLTAFAQLQYSNTSITGGLNYDYVLGRLGVSFGF